MRRPLPIILVICLAVVAGCAGLSQVNIISTEDEIAMGAQFAKEIESGEIKLWRDPEVQAYIDSLGQVLARHSDRTDIPYIIKVVDTDEVNAFAIPGGYLYVNRGLITTAENESELAGVMGHEIGHIVGRHSAKQITRQYGLSVLSGVLLGSDPSAVAQITSGLVGNGALLKYGRDAELEADSYGIMETYRAGIDPNGMATFFEKLLGLHDSQPSGLEKLFSTHPPTAERIAQARAQIAQLPAKSNLAKDSARFHAIKNKLPALKKEKK